MSRAEYILAAAGQALREYDISEATLSEKNEVGNMLFERYQTIKFACDTNSGRRLLSIHVLKEGTDPVEASKFFVSQLLWLEALARDTALSVQTPIRNNTNKVITLAPGTPDILFTLTSWVPGQLLERDEIPLSLEQARAMGILLAQVHQHSEGWTPPAEFYRPEHPVVQLDINIARLEQALAENRIAASDFAVIQRVAERVKSILQDCGRQPGSWGLLHGDFTAGNCVIDQGQLSPIDFDWCCVGNYLGDIARCLLMHEADAQVTHSFLAGYQSIRGCEADSVELLETLTLATVLWIWSDSVDRQTEFAQVPSFVGREFDKYLREESFIFDRQRTWI